MILKNYLILVFVSLSLLLSSCINNTEKQYDSKIESSSNDPEQSYDKNPIDSVTIRLDSIKIGNQIWSTNLDLKSFSNGDKIKCAKNMEEWIKANLNEEPIWAHYNFDSTNEKNYGLLYNYFVISDDRSLHIENWRLPEIKDWYELGDYIRTNYPTEGKPNLFTSQLGGCIWVDYRTLKEIKKDHYQITEKTKILFEQLNIGGFWWSNNVLKVGQDNNGIGEKVICKSGITFYCKNWNYNIFEGASPIFEGKSIRLIRNN